MITPMLSLLSAKDRVHIEWINSLTIHSRKFKDGMVKAYILSRL
jgi:hypothetical protein